MLRGALAKLPHPNVAAGEDYHEDAKNNRTRQDSAQGAIVKWYASLHRSFPTRDGMEMGIAPNLNTTAKHKYVCARTARSGAHFPSQILLGDEKHSGPMGIPKDMGAFNIRWLRPSPPNRPSQSVGTGRGAGRTKAPLASRMSRRSSTLQLSTGR